MTAQQRVLVAHASELGSTAEVARAIGVELRACGAMVEVMPVVEVKDLRAFDAAIIGSPIYNGRWLPEAIHFVEFHVTELSRMPVAYFLVSATARDGSEQSRRNARSLLDPLLTSMPQVAPVEIGLFGGQIDVHKLPWSVRLRIRLLTTLRHGDYRDWEAIRAWTRHTAPRLGVQNQ